MSSDSKTSKTRSVQILALEVSVVLHGPDFIWAHVWAHSQHLGCGKLWGGKMEKPGVRVFGVEWKVC